jgi:hypothetical protein
LLNTKNITIAENTPENSQPTIYESTLEGLSENTNLILQATNDITINALSDNKLSLGNYRSKDTFNADVDGDGIGNFQMQTGDTIRTGGDVSISGASLTLGKIDTSANIILGNNNTIKANIMTTPGGDVSISGVSLTLGDIDTRANIILDNNAIFYTNANTITTLGGDVRISGTSLVLGNIDTIANIILGDNGISHTNYDLRGGNITLTATESNISTQYLNSSSFSQLNSGIAGNGGEITLTAQGNISTQYLNSSSFSQLNSGIAGNGGEITLTAQGNISTQYLDSFSFSESNSDTAAGNGGEITLTAQGDIKGIRNQYNQYYDEVPVFSSFSISETGVSGQGGNVTLAAKNQITDLEILTLSSDSKSGDVQIKGFGDLSLTNTDIITSKQLAIRRPFQEDIIIDVGGVGQSGNVTVNSIGNLTFNNSRIESDTKGSDPAGNITITSPGTVTFNNNTISKITSNTSSQGKAGNIEINANNLVLTDASEISASTTADGKAGDITLNTPTLTVANDGKIFATTTGIGDGGTITINAPNKVNLGIGVQDFTPILSVPELDVRKSAKNEYSKGLEAFS